MLILGYDGGFGIIKTSENVMFPAKIKQFTRNFKDEDIIKITYDNKSYTIGEGSYIVDMDKSANNGSLIFLLTALALSDPEETNFKVVTGLPIKQYKKYKSKLYHDFMKQQIHIIKLGDIKRTIVLDDLFVFPQCLGSFYSLNTKELQHLFDSDILIVDIGTRTVDISLISLEHGERKVKKYSTILEGTLSLYSDFIYLLNDTFELDLKVEDCERILRNGLYLEGVKQDLKFTKDIIMEHLYEIIKEIDLNYPVKTCASYVTGGGAYLYGQVLIQRFPGMKIMDNAQFSNAIGFKKVGEQLWEK